MKDFPVFLEVGEKKYFVEYEAVNGIRSSVRIKNKTVNVRLSRFLQGRKRDKTVNEFLSWAFKQFSKAEEVDFVNPVYEDGATIVTHNKCYQIYLFVEDRSKSKVVFEKEVIRVYLGNEFSDVERMKIFKDRVERKIMEDQLPYLKEVLNELNELYFKESYGKVRFKRVVSRFGSLSSKGNINIAFRLLFAPREVFRYVCVHELAHLKEFNHSKKFWKHVESACPDYKTYEKWLKTNGFLLG